MSTLSTKYKTIIVLVAIFAATASAAVILHHQDANRTTESTHPVKTPPFTEQLHQTDQSEQYRSEPGSPQLSKREREHPPTSTNQAGPETPHDFSRPQPERAFDRTLGKILGSWQSIQEQGAEDAKRADLVFRYSQITEEERDEVHRSLWSP